MPKRRSDENEAASEARVDASERPTLGPFQRSEKVADAPGEQTSHERTIPAFGPFMSAFANHLANSQPSIEAASPDGLTRRALLLQMSKLFSQSEFDAALAVADRVAESHLAHDVVAYLARTCRTELEGNYREILGGLDRVPRRRNEDADAFTAALDYREAFMLSQIDGLVSYEALVDISPMRRYETLQMLERLLGLGAIE